MGKIKVTCTPGRQCLNCPYEDCIRSVRKIYSEEVDMIKCASLPVDRSHNKKQKKLPVKAIMKNSVPIIALKI
ncbi:MAG: hypothetical protein IIW48_10590 [Clostridia bacterium]|nr:hypothetical protein [Clostridia bacterium]